MDLNFLSRGRPKILYVEHSTMNQPLQPNDYPKVMSAHQTLQALCTGEYRGLARYGDGDFAVMRGQRDRYQKWDPALAWRLAQSLRTPTPGVLNAIIPPPGQGELANQRWHCYYEANAGVVGLLPDRVYGNAAITRIDSNRQLHTEEYWLEISKLWVDKDVTLIRGTDRSLTPQMLLDSPGSPESVTDIIGPGQNAWDKYGELEAKALASKNEVILLCTGLVARPLVHSFVLGGHKAYDLGHLGVWFKDGKPKPWEDCR